MVVAEVGRRAAQKGNRSMERVSERPVLDVSGIPSVVFGARNPVWLGTVFFMLIEGAAMAMIYASYFYYRTRTNDWPPGLMPPALRYGVINAIVFVLSLAPAWWIRKQARANDVAGCRIGLVTLTLFGVANIVLRGFEFASLNCDWTANAYASTIWMLMGMHSAHLLTDAVETGVLATLTFTDRVDGKAMTDFDENSMYWYFVVGIALLTDFVVYGTSRMF
jgi:heme/copper-type cytochrome/quinol oxidase subunit 3